MLSEKNAQEINRQIEDELRSLKWAHSEDRRTRIMNRIKELKALLDELDSESSVSADDEIVISLDEVVDTLRDIFRRRRNRHQN